MTHGSLFAGIEGFGEGFRRVGFKTLWQVEKEPFCIAVLKTRFPDVERYYDVLKCGHDRIHKLRAVDVLTAGFPCQDLSVAGKRAGLEGARSGLFWEVVRILGELRTPWFVLENVPGLFSSAGGSDFLVLLRALDELGYGLAWRVLDSQYFGVAQGRRRVFIVGRIGKPCPEEVLFESAGGGWDSATGGEERQDIAAPLTRGSGVTGNAPGRRREDDFNLAIASSGQRARAITGSCWKRHDEDTDTLVATALSASAGHHGHSSPRGDGSDNLVNCLAPVGGGPDDNDAQAGHIVIQDVRGGTRDKTDAGQGIGIRRGGPCYTLGVTEQHGVAFALRNDPGGTGQGHNTTYAVSAPSDSDRVRDFAGLPEGMDSSRYRALGNAVTVNVATWIAKRILEAEARVSGATEEK